MNKVKLLTTTAIFAGVLAVTSPAMAVEGQGWYATMKDKVAAWFSHDKTAASSTASANTDIEAYLDEVTVSVPPMAADEASSIEPAAGGATNTDIDYKEIENLRDQGSTLNTEFDYKNAVTAFSDPATAEELNAIETAAGDAEEVTDQSVIVVDGNDAEEITDESVVVAVEGESAVEDKAEAPAEGAEAEATVTVKEIMDEADAKIEASAEEADAAINKMDKAVEAETPVEVDAKVDSPMPEAETEAVVEGSVETTTETPAQ